MKTSDQILKEIHGSDNPLKTAMDNGCHIKARKPNDYEKKHRILPLFICIPVPIREIKFKFKLEFKDED